MQILITGGAGYLGSVSSRTLIDSGHTVRVLDNLLQGGRSLLGLVGDPRFEFIRGDVRDAAAVEQALAGVDAVVHLAAIVGDPACAVDPALARSVNLEGTLALMDAARAAGVSRVVFASTCSNYGRMSDTSLLATEDHELQPLSLYAETKVACERSLLGRAGEPMTATVLRFATLFGLSPRMRFDLTVNQFVMEMMVRRKLVVYGEHFWRPYVHVHDAARAIAAVLSAPAEQVNGQVFNVGDTTENYRKLDLVGMITERVGAVDVAYVSVAEDPRDYKVSFARIAERLGFTITHDVVQGIDEIARAITAGILEPIDDPLYSNVRAARPIELASA